MFVLIGFSLLESANLSAVDLDPDVHRSTHVCLGSFARSIVTDDLRSIIILSTIMRTKGNGARVFIDL